MIHDVSTFHTHISENFITLGITVVLRGWKRGWGMKQGTKSKVTLHITLMSNKCRMGGDVLVLVFQT
jgi:hypothetical protein